MMTQGKWLPAWVGIAVIVWLADGCARTSGGESPSSSVSQAASVGAAASSLPPLPLLTDAQGTLLRSASTVVNAFDWDAGEYPDTGFGYLMPSNHTRDLRVRTENCDQVGEPEGEPTAADAHVCIFATVPDALPTPLSRADFSPMTQPLNFPSVAFHGVADAGSCVGKGQESGPCVAFSRGMRLICDAPDSGLRNPYTCGPFGGYSATGEHDCYDVVHLGVLMRGTPAAGGTASYTEQMVGTHITVVVAHPKSKDAVVSAVNFGAIDYGPEFPQSQNDLFTPSVSGDGHLLVANGSVGTEYSYSPAACDVTQWKDFYPVTQMYLDPNVNHTYGVARFPIRDTENNLLAPDAGLTTGGYFWMDTNATLLFFNYARGNSAFYWNGSRVVERYTVDAITADGNQSPPTPAQIRDAGTEAAFEGLMLGDGSGLAAGDVSTHDALAFFGLWTNGKVVMPDTPLNKNTLGIPKQLDYRIDLYSDVGNPVSWRLMSADIRRKAGFENAFNHLPNLEPDDARDVVWKVSTNEDQDEFVFDDLVSPETLVFSGMNAPAYFDVNVYRIDDGYGGTDPQGFDGTGAGPVRVENLATSPSPATVSALGALVDAGFVGWNVPPFGTLQGGGRVEPIAAGGVQGAGLYLNGGNWLEYDVPASQSAAMRSDAGWYASLWVDPRGDLSQRQVLWSVTAPASAGGHESRLSLVGPTTVRVEYDGVASDLAVPSVVPFANGQWTHVALAATPDGGVSQITLSIDGYAAGVTSLPNPGAFVPLPGSVIDVGGGPNDAHFQGWTDEFRVTSRIPDPEEICRHAYGTLVRVTQNDGASWSYADGYPQWSHEAIADLIGDTGAEYFCETSVRFTAAPKPEYCILDIRRPDLQPDRSRCIGRRIVFPNGPVIPGVPRPDGTANPFCHSCHSVGNQSFSLTPAALAPSQCPDGGLYLSELDPRRQPLQPRQWTSGVIPLGMFCDSADAGVVPATTLWTDGILTDRWVYECK